MPAKRLRYSRALEHGEGRFCSALSLILNLDAPAMPPDLVSDPQATHRMVGLGISDSGVVTFQRSASPRLVVPLKHGEKRGTWGKSTWSGYPSVPIACSSLDYQASLVVRPHGELRPWISLASSQRIYGTYLPTFPPPNCVSRLSILSPIGSKLAS